MCSCRTRRDRISLIFFLSVSLRLSVSAIFFFYSFILSLLFHSITLFFKKLATISKWCTYLKRVSFHAANIFNNSNNISGVLPHICYLSVPLYAFLSFRLLFNLLNFFLCFHFTSFLSFFHLFYLSICFIFFPFWLCKLELCVCVCVRARENRRGLFADVIIYTLSTILHVILRRSTLLSLCMCVCLLLLICVVDNGNGNVVIFRIKKTEAEWFKLR